MANSTFKTDPAAVAPSSTAPAAERASSQPSIKSSTLRRRREEALSEGVDAEAPQDGAVEAADSAATPEYASEGLTASAESSATSTAVASVEASGVAGTATSGLVSLSPSAGLLGAVGAMSVAAVGSGGGNWPPAASSPPPVTVRLPASIDEHPSSPGATSAEPSASGAAPSAPPADAGDTSRPANESQPQAPIHAPLGALSLKGVNPDQMTWVGRAGVVLDGLAADARWQFSVDGGTTWQAGNGQALVGAAIGSEGRRSLALRQVEAEGQVGPVSQFDLMLDLTNPAAPIAMLATDSGDPTDLITRQATVRIRGREPRSEWQYSLDGGTVWQAGVGDQIDDDQFTGSGLQQVLVRQIDLAGNVSEARAFEFVLDRQAAAPSLQLKNDTGVDAQDSITRDATMVVGGLEPGARWQYSLDKGRTWTVGEGSELPASALGSAGSKSVLVRQIDVAGNVSESQSLNFTLDDAAAPPVILGASVGQGDRLGWLTVFGTGEPGATVEVRDTQGDQEGRAPKVVVGADGRWSVSFDGGAYSVSDFHEFTAWQSDRAGNDSGWSDALAMDASLPSVTIDSATDDSRVEGRVLSSDQSTLDRTPLLSGTLSRALSDEIVVIYAGRVRLGEATVDDTRWTFQMADTSPGDVRLTARVENTAGAQGASSPAFDLHVLGSSTALVVRNAAETLLAPEEVHSSASYAIHSTPLSTRGSVADLDVSRLALSLDCYGSKFTATALLMDRSVDGQVTFWAAHFDDARTRGIQLRLTDVAQGGIALEVLRAADVTGTAMASSFDGPKVTDRPLVSVANGAGFALRAIEVVQLFPPISGDARPVLSGTLAATPGHGEEVAIYATIDGESRALGIAQVSGREWRYQATTDLPGGEMIVQAVVQPAGAQTVSSGLVVTSGSLYVDIVVPAAVTLAEVLDDSGNGTAMGAIALGASTDDATPSLSGTLSAPLARGHRLAVYDTVAGQRTLLGTATVGADGQHWSFTPNVPLAHGAHVIEVQAESLSSGRLGASDSWSLQIGAMGAMTVVDEVGARQGTLTSGSTTDDAHPGMSGRLTAPLGSGEEVAVYVTVDGTTRRLGIAEVHGLTWTFKSTEALADGAYSARAVVQAAGVDDLAQARISSASFDFTVLAPVAPTQMALIAHLSEAAAVAGPTDAPINSALLPDQSTAQRRPSIIGTLSEPLLAGQAVGIYDTINGVLVRQGTATVDATGRNWAFNPTSDLSLGLHQFSARVEQSSSGRAGEMGETFAIRVQGALNFSVRDEFGASRGLVSRGSAIDDATPSFAGSLVVPPAAGEVVAIYGTNAEGARLLGHATVDGLNWTFKPVDPLGPGNWSFTAVIQPAEATELSQARAASAGFSVTVINLAQPLPTASIALAEDNVSVHGSLGTSARPVRFGTGQSTDDNTPFLSGTLAEPLPEQTRLVVYDDFGGVRISLGVATVNGTSWTFSPPRPLGEGAHQLSVRVERPADGQTGALSEPFELQVHGALTMTMTDTVGPRQGVIANGGGADDVPTLSGRLTAPLGQGEVLAIYDVSGSQPVKLGDASVSGMTWTFQPPDSLSGSLSFKPVIQGAGETDIALARVAGAVTTVVVDASDAVPTAIGVIDTVQDAVNVARYIVIRGNPDAGRLWLNAREVEVMSHGENVALGKSTFSVFGFSSPGANMVDGNPNTSGISNSGTNDTNYMFVDLGANYQIDSIRVVGNMAKVTIFGLPDGVVINRSYDQLMQTDGVFSKVFQTFDNGVAYLNPQRSMHGHDESVEDFTPTLRGRLDTPLTAEDVLAVFDTLDGETTRLGAAVIFHDGTGLHWTFTPSALLSAGRHSFSVRVENLTNGHVGPMSEPFVVNIQDGLTMTVSDRVGAWQGALHDGDATDDDTPDFSGLLNAPLGAGEVVAVFAKTATGEIKIGEATAVAAGSQWRWSLTSAPLTGQMSFFAVIQSAGLEHSSSNRIISEVITLQFGNDRPDQIATIDRIQDHVSPDGTILSIPAGRSTDDRQPWLSGSLSAPLKTAQQLVVIDVVDGVRTRLGIAEVSGTHWTFRASSALAAGSHRLQVVVENIAAGVHGPESAEVRLQIHDGLSIVMTDTVGTHTGTVAAGGACDDVPVLSGRLSAPLGAGESVVLFDQTIDGTVRLGEAVVVGQAWRFVIPPGLVSDGVHHFRAAILGVGETLATASVVGDSVQVTVDSNSAAPVAVPMIDSAVSTTQSGRYVMVRSNPEHPKFWLRLNELAVMSNGENVALGKPVFSGTGFQGPPSYLDDGDLGTLTQTNSATDTAGWLLVDLGKTYHVDSIQLTGMTDFKLSLFLIPDGVDPATLSYESILNMRDAGRFIWNGTGTANSTLTNLTGVNREPLTSGQSTDDTTPTLRGSLSGLLRGAETLVVYDEIGGVRTRIGVAKVDGNQWSFTPETPLAAGRHQLSVVVENPANGQVGASMASFELSVQRLSVDRILDNEGPRMGDLAGGQPVSLATHSREHPLATDDLTPSLSGHLSAPLGAGESVTIWDNGLRLGTAVVENGVWSFTPTGLLEGVHALTVRIESAGMTRAASDLIYLSVGGSAPTQGVLITTVADGFGPETTAHLAPGAITDDRQLTLSGIVGSPELAGNQVVAIYEGETRLGTAQVTGETWRFQLPDGSLAMGHHALTAVVENLATGAKGAPSAAFEFDLQQIRITGIHDDVGHLTGNMFVAGGRTLTDDTIPMLSGTLGHALEAGQTLVVFDGELRLGTATVDGTDWHFQTNGLRAVLHELTLRLQGADGTTLLSSAGHLLDIQNNDLATLVGADRSLVLRGAGQILDLTLLDNTGPLRDVGRIDLTGSGDNQLRLGVDEVLFAGVDRLGPANGWHGLESGGRSQLVIDGTAGDSIEVVDSGWVAEGSVQHQGHTYLVYTHQTVAAQLLIDDAIGRQGFVQ